MMRPIESSNLRVDGIVETCINVAEINRSGCAPALHSGRV
jgi:hypothetical protein